MFMYKFWLLECDVIEDVLLLYENEWLCLFGMYNSLMKLW